MAGVLSFALGLETSAFAGALDKAGSRLLSFLAVGKLVESAFEGVMNAIERGGALSDLSNRTGESVASLYELQEAFNVVGVAADSLPGMINRLNMSLSGVSETGQRTDEAFAALGLSIADLKRMDAPAQFAAITEKMAGLDKASRADVASRLFGREGAGNILQISRDAKSFADTMQDAAKEAAVFARNAAAFDQLGDTITRVRGHLTGLFAGVAEGIVPTLQGVADALNHLDLVAIGQNIGTMFAGAFQAFREGKISLLIGDSIVAGFQIAAEMIPGLFAKLGVVLLKVFEQPLILLQTGLEYIIQLAMEGIGKIPGIGKASGFENFKAQDFGQIWDERRKKGFEAFFEGNNLDNMNQAANDSLAGGLDNVKKQWSDLFKEFADFAARAPKPVSAEISKTISSAGISNQIMPEKVTGNALEKIGFIFNGGAAMDPAKQTVQNTRRIADLLTTTNQLLGGFKPTSLVNS